MRILSAKRKSLSEPFGSPQFIATGEGIFEGPALSPDEKSLYYHKILVPGKKTVLYVMSRK